LDFFNQSLPIVREVKDRSGEATTLNNIGQVYSEIGQPQKALDVFNQALPIEREVKNRSGEATTLSNIAHLEHKDGMQSGLKPGAALRAAQLEMWHNQHYAPPYYWAAFTLQGE
jgi:tetratricopeptide (TPR) repeat protein